MKLAPLRISAGWKIKQNHFYEIKPEKCLMENGYLDFPFVQNIFHASYPHKRLVMDIGWCPEGDPNGSYILVLLKGEPEPNTAYKPKRSIEIKKHENTYRYVLDEDNFIVDWDKPLVEFISKDYKEIQEKIDWIFSKF